jgi:hypothetical protein
VVVLAVLSGPACRSEEHEVLDRFLDASRRGDHQMVAMLSLVAFPEEVVDWDVLSIGEPRREPYRVPELRERVVAAEDRRDRQFRAFGEFRQENFDDLARIQRRLRDEPEASFTGRQLELYEAWERFREERREVVTSLHEAERALEWEIRRVNKSLQRDSTPEYLDGETVERVGRVRVSGSGRIYAVTLLRYDVQNQFDAVVPARWIITAVEPEDGESAIAEPDPPEVVP